MTSKAVVAVVAEHDLDLEVLALGALEGGGAETGGHAVIFRDTTVSWLSNYVYGVCFLDSTEGRDKKIVCFCIQFKKKIVHAISKFFCY